MWEGYMRDVLGWKDQSSTTTISNNKSSNQNKSDKILNIGDEQFRMRICRADFHGALVKITKSRDPSQIGVQVLLTIHRMIHSSPTFTVLLIPCVFTLILIFIILKDMLYYRDSL